MATSPFVNAGLSQFGQELSGLDSKNELGKFIIGAALTQMGAPPELTSFITKEKAIAPPTALVNPQLGMANAVVPGQTMQNPEDERTSFSQGFGSLFSHLPTFGK